MANLHEGRIVSWYSAIPDRKQRNSVPVGEEQDLCDVLPPPILKAIKRMDDEDDRHRGVGITCTALLACPRATLIQRLMEYECDFQRVMSATFGGVIHKQLALWNCDEEWLNEGVNRDMCEVGAPLFGVWVDGLIDRLRRDDGAIMDYKTSMSGNSRYSTGVPSLEHRAQLSLLAHMVAYKRGVLPQDLYIVRVDRQIKQEGPVEPMPLEQIAVLRPYGAQITVEDIAEVLDISYKRYNEGHPIEDLVKCLPMVGQSMKFGKQTACDFCHCWTTCGKLGEQHV